MSIFQRGFDAFVTSHGRVEGMYSGMALSRRTALSWLRTRVASITKITAGCGATITTSIPEGFSFGRPQAQAPDLQKRIVRPFKLGLSYSHARRVDTAPRVCTAIHRCAREQTFSHPRTFSMPPLKCSFSKRPSGLGVENDA